MALLTGWSSLPPLAAWRPAAFALAFYGLRLWLDDLLLVDAWDSPGWKRGAHAQRRLAQGSHALLLEFRDRGGRSALRVRWTGGPVPPNSEIGPPRLRKR